MPFRAFFSGRSIVMVLLGLLASMFGWLFMWMLIGSLISLALFFTRLRSIKALQGEWLALPWVGPFLPSNTSSDSSSASQRC